MDVRSSIFFKVNTTSILLQRCLVPVPDITEIIRPRTKCGKHQDAIKLHRYF